MKLVVGLGNPGPKYETTRHNVGFLAVDRLIDDWKATGPQYSYEGEIYTANVGGEKVLLVKPETFMNLSGRCVGPLMKFYKLAPEDLIVIQDEVDLKPFTLKLKAGGGTGGHNGLKSIDAHVGSQAYHRIRIGVGHPRMFNMQMDVADYVLKPFTQGELKQLDVLLDEVARATQMIVEGKATQAMNQFNIERDPSGKSP